jgi:hypothetical protein
MPEIKITIESDSDDPDFYYNKVVTDEQFQDILANLEVMLDDFPDGDWPEEEDPTETDTTEETKEAGNGLSNNP